ncbi:hypothetical protein U9R90_14605 [Streptomyces sp. E11-3]|uniref:hypothetical protein n=1 Tax=Streptomyces sp. E11-3 TaxID=3110112 RepID=UPI0039810EC3
MSGDADPPPADLPSASPPAPKRRRLDLFLAASVGVVVGAGALGAVWAFTGSGDGAAPPETTGSVAPSAPDTTAPATFTLTGTFELTAGVVSDGSGGCKGGDGYDDIAEGTAVTVYDAAGSVVATAYLGESTRVGTTCRFDVSVDDVPTGKGFYKVEVSHRGTVQLTEADARAGAFGATLG